MQLYHVRMKLKEQCGEIHKNNVQHFLCLPKNDKF
jgi:hypothetical protein